MTTTSYHYMTHTLLFDGLEKFLNDLDRLAESQYDIISIFEKQCIGNKSVVGIVIRFHIISELEFDEEEIKRKLGF